MKKFASKIVWQMTDNGLELVSKTEHEYGGPWAELKGASPAQNALLASQTNFFNALMNNYNTVFGEQQQILNTIKSVYTPIFNLGPSQPGLSAQAETAMRTSASDWNAQLFTNAMKSINQEIASRGGGNIFVPSGAEDQLRAGVNIAGATQEAQAQNAITKYNYDVGRQNWVQAAQGLEQSAAIQNPVPTANAAESAGQSAFSDATQVWKEGQSGLWGTIGGILGGAAGSFLGPIGTSLGSQIGGILGGGGGNGMFGGGSAPSPMTDTSFAPGFSQGYSEAYT